MSSSSCSASLWLLFLGLAEALLQPWSSENMPQGSLDPVKGAMSLAAVPKVDVGSVTDRFHAEFSNLSARYDLSLAPGSLIPHAGPGTTNNANPVGGNTAYNIQLNIGGQNVNMDPDTGSNILWIPNFQTAGNRPAPYSWDPAKSTTSYTYKNSSWSVSYLSAANDAAGQVYGDNIYWDDVGASAELHNTYVFLADSSGSTPNGGVLGLDLNKVAAYTQNGVAKNAPTFWQRLIPTLPQPLFTVDFKHNANGSLDFGFIDAKKYTGNIFYGQVVPGTLWQSATTGYRFQTTSTTVSDTTQSISFVVDTGSSLMYLPKNIVTKYWNMVKGAVFGSGGYWLFPCSSTLPDITIYFGGRPSVTPGRYVNYGSLGNGSCYGGLQNTPFTNGLSLFGDTWIRSQFLVFKNATGGNPPYIGIASKPLTA